MPFVFIVTLYNVKDVSRGAEFIYCLKKNLDNPHISEIIIFYEISLSEDIDIDIFLPKLQSLSRMGTTYNVDTKNIVDPKIKIKIIDVRPNFGYLFSYANKNYQTGQQIIVANADVYYHPQRGLNLLEELNFNKLFIVLTRYNRLDWILKLSKQDIKGKGLIAAVESEGQLITQGINGSSIDSWIFQTPLPNDLLKCPYFLGQVRCDSWLNNDLLKHPTLKVFNPCLDVVSIHQDQKWSPAKYQTVKHKNKIYTLQEWDKINKSRHGRCTGRISFCRLNKIPQKYWLSKGVIINGRNNDSDNVGDGVVRQLTHVEVALSK